MQPENGKRKKLLVLCFCLFTFALFLLGDSTGDLRPTADGATEQWTNEAGTSCASTTCYTEVNEASGANCSTTPGDSADNKAPATSGQQQLYDLDESGIPDNSTVTSAVVRGCVIRGGSQNAGFQFKFCINGSCTDGSTLTSTSSYADYSSTIDFPDDTKTSSDDYEIGIETTQARAVWLTAIKTDITYTPAPGGAPRRVFVTLNLRPSTGGRTP